MNFLLAASVVVGTAGSSNDAKIAAFAAVAGALIGALAAIIPNLVVERHRTRKAAEQVEASLVAEIAALLEIASERKYLQSLGEIAAHLRTQPAGTPFPFSVAILLHYSRIYQANAQRVGLLPASRAADIVRFHQLIDAVVQDFLPGGVMDAGAPLEAFEQDVQIFSRALALGHLIVNRKV